MNYKHIFITIILTSIVTSICTWVAMYVFITEYGAANDKNMQCNKYRNNVVERFDSWYSSNDSKKAHSPEIFYSTHINDCVAIFIDYQDETTRYAILNPITFKEYSSFLYRENSIQDELTSGQPEKRLNEFFELEKLLKDGMVSNF